MSAPAGFSNLPSSRAMYAPFFGTMGITAAMVCTAAGSAYGILRSGSGIAMASIHKMTTDPESKGISMKALVPVVMAGIIGIYGLVAGVILAGRVEANSEYTVAKSASHLAAGLACGFCGLGAGYAIGVVGEAGVIGLVFQPRIFIGVVLILIFSEVLGLYGLIISLVIAKT